MVEVILCTPWIYALEGVEDERQAAPFTPAHITCTEHHTRLNMNLEVKHIYNIWP